MALLEVNDLSVEFGRRGQVLRAVDAVHLRVDEGEILGIVGESGSGKSVTSLAIMGLIPYPGRVSAERLSFAGRDLLGMDRPTEAAPAGKLSRRARRRLGRERTGL